MRLLGPNCLGTLNTETGLCTSFSAVFSRGFPSPGPVGIVSQSGAYGAHVLHLASQRGIGTRYWITTGNEADVDAADAIEWMAHRPEVRVILAYVERVRDGGRFLAALEAARWSKTPVVLLKTESSDTVRGRQTRTRAPWRDLMRSAIRSRGRTGSIALTASTSNWMSSTPVSVLRRSEDAISAS